MMLREKEIFHFFIFWFIKKMGKMGKCISKICKSLRCKNGKVTNAKSRKCALHRIFHEKNKKDRPFSAFSVREAFLTKRNAEPSVEADKDDIDHCTKQATWKMVNWIFLCDWCCSVTKCWKNVKWNGNESGQHNESMKPKNLICILM